MFDVVVIGGGHAGTEAAAAAARRGAHTALLSFDRHGLGAMSCNPAIGGLGKGHIVREVDAFDGLIGRAADEGAIHYRMLNRSKGTAVQGPRVQADRRRYAGAIQAILAAQPKLTIVEGEAEALVLDGDRVAGVQLADGTTLAARAVVLATGTFLGGRLFRGEERHLGGRIGERAATRMAEQLRALGLPMARMKTGTPPRLDGRTIDWAKLDEQPSDSDPWTMSPMTAARPLPQIACAITRTTEETHAIIAAAFHRSPLFTGAIEANGPRYCPSIEDKIKRFADRDSHQIFLEPEGLDDPLVYPNGLSTSLPTDVQEAMIASMPGLERAVITLPGYAVEYDHIDPRALDARLALGALAGVFCAGQINGTTGYEEAAGQGLIAGLNAAAHACDWAPVILDRASSYLGVMIDDLVLQGVTEPYRMLTARAEYRLSLRADNAESRLGGIAEAAGCLSPERLAHRQRRLEQRTVLRDRLATVRTASDLARSGAAIAQDGARRTAYEWLRFDGVTLAHVVPDAADGLDPAVVAETLEDARYAPYVERQAEEVARLRADEQILLPISLDYAAIPGLSQEMIDRLSLARPATLAAASRIRGITPAALSAVLLHARKMAA
ncbi:MULTISPECIES: tRNA uridine-5-carboxymethylaminomethyl(34) synthesis enzyme MnmG [Sphingomonas]|jgi:tRNA uridine 5-carboxymethylaminomethyl modification enzyme|uniref:tRNA uridine 5-carboxymethylaminomethyl modification enzyme MnmG n=1 Tax=Sphingomonas paucimobilis TaxID=13689 RepID=A0A411LKS4_SPHPI|nr:MULTISPECIES: tRNA uridine-5-carboxymethylaminomethyl(34) synthesis enzyme MnmG [Sphingomonas]MBQ1480586.1 tRNA uridine-5-carboxymethylaminomethyl(34) synthesis enzyme MnmG [Sphingomonas sp.]MCM3680487.1 tRNA uridine-5-carboxymethylaminomethyl(34) synthesis enzyme MnmG [Sphingomonas paucimobilis]MDG5970097.1 tRNA uridine-5-carboxymethylaminomethyl(34) synthesis enzyme MnmG [Sphingomonas paucimobilis]NNG57340.1 tRNA uridine-5-carboxymethylaminomethyl(34) synthesis enzyme MnmG [Sphingomonas pa